MEKTEVKKVSEFETHFELLISLGIENKVKSQTIHYEIGSGATFNICKWANYLTLKCYKVAVVIKYSKKEFIDLYKYKLIKLIDIVPQDKIDNLRGNQYDFVFIDNCEPEGYHEEMSKFTIKLLRNLDFLK